MLSIPIALIGLLDDLSDISIKYRFLIQLLTAFVLTYYSKVVLNFSNPVSSILSLLIYFFLVLMIVSIINFVNFMDGIDGLVTGTMAIIFLVIGITFSHSGFIVFSSLLAFLYWNWQPSKIFMGDVGSTFLGSVFGGLLLNSGSLNLSISIILIASPLFADAFFTVIRRFKYKKNIFAAHKSHLYQRLHQNGFSHSVISIGYILAVSFLGFAYLLLGLDFLIFFAIILLMFGLYLDSKVAKTFI